MRRLGSLLLLLGLCACSDDKKPGTPASDENASFSYKTFSERFKTVATPYVITDTALLMQKDTALLRYPEFASFLPDSLQRSLFGKQHPRYTPLAHITGAGDFFVVRATAGERRVALLYDFDQKAFRSVFPLLIPDDNTSTSQVSSIDRTGAITRAVSRKGPKEQLAEGKDVYLYNTDLKTYTLIVTDPLDDRSEVLNPIDTLAKKHVLSGDYVKDEHNIVSIRDARNPSELLFFIHFEKGEGDEHCTGEIKGTALITSSRTAVYRQGGDPCVLELTFGTNSVTLRETEGCGSHRGVRCVFEGSFPRKKAVSLKSTGRKKAKK
jgi:hypothetical protein